MRRVVMAINGLAAALAALACLVPAAAQLDGNSDEAKVAPYRLPDPLIASWRAHRAKPRRAGASGVPSSSRYSKRTSTASRPARFVRAISSRSRKKPRWAVLQCGDR